MLAAIVGTACAPFAALPDRGLQGPTVTLPLAVAGIADARQPFSELFERELRAVAPAGSNASGRNGTDPSTANTWLHGVPAESLGRVAPSQGLDARFAARAPSTSVLIVPGLLGDCVAAQSVPFGDGVMRTPQRSSTEAYRQYDDLHLLDVRLIPVPGRVSSAANGHRIAEVLRSESQRPGVQRIVIVAYSKGLPDVLHALAELQTSGGVPPTVDALVSVAGVVMGTPVADHFEVLFNSLSPALQPLDCTPSDGQEMTSVTRHERVAWLSAHPPPAGLHYYSIISHAPRDEIAVPLRPMFDMMSVVDLRNDGQLFASDTFLPGSVLLAEARADHWDVALPRDRHPNAVMRSLTSGRAYPREALFRATIRWVVGAAKD
jgi:hypothetical protein